MYTASVRLAALLLCALFLGGSCGGDDGPADASAGTGDAARPDAGGPGSDAGVCTGSDDCGGNVCCGTGVSSSCVPTFDDCAGLVLCDGPDDCPEVNPTCCPQGFCGGCD